MISSLLATPPVSAKPSVQVPEIFQNGQQQELVVVVVVVVGVVIVVVVVVVGFVVVVDFVLVVGVVVIVGVVFGDEASPVALVLDKTLAFVTLGAGNVCAVAGQICILFLLRGRRRRQQSNCSFEAAAFVWAAEATAGVDATSASEI